MRSGVLAAAVSEEPVSYTHLDVYKRQGELREYSDYVKSHPEVRPVLFIEAIREHNVAKISPENVVFDLWRPCLLYTS